jgi:hypothetical protein
MCERGIVPAVRRYRCMASLCGMLRASMRARCCRSVLSSCGPVQLAADLLCVCVACVFVCLCVRAYIYVGSHERVLLFALATHFAWARASQARRVRGNGAGYHVRSRGRLPGCPLARAALEAAHDHMLNVDLCRVCCLFCVHPWICDGMKTIVNQTQSSKEILQK